jgi:hypothetical protein
MTEQLHLFAPPRPIGWSGQRCVDCWVDTYEIEEGYMVRDDVWPIGPLDGKLCVGCLEARIGRRLRPADFEDVPLNRPTYKSSRLRSRLRGER